jgi:hypothetical protein
LIYIQGHSKRQGKEADLVDRFLTSYLHLYNPDETLTILIEPRLGFAEPDLIIVEWDNEISTSWPKERSQLTASDIKLISYISSSGPTPLDSLREFFPRIRKSRLLHLERIGVISLCNGFCIPQDRKISFAARSIIAIEAKTSLSMRVIEQAFRNMLFAEMSYIVTSTSAPNPASLERAATLGLGVYSFPQTNDLAMLVPPNETPLPITFHSWFVNELAWRATINHSYVH